MQARRAFSCMGKLALLNKGNRWQISRLHVEESRVVTLDELRTIIIRPVLRFAVGLASSQLENLLHLPTRFLLIPNTQRFFVGCRVTRGFFFSYPLECATVQLAGCLRPFRPLRTQIS